MTHDDAANAGQIEYWNLIAGAKWVANQARLDQLMAPLSEALVEAIAPEAGSQVLEIGPGCGDLALRLAGPLGAAGHVLAVDVSEPMLAHAAARDLASRSDRRASIDWRHADAMVERFEPSHDLLVSRFGVMFFDDRTRAFANLRTALKPGGRFVFLTWRTRAENQWMQVPLDWIAPIVPTPPEIPGEIGPYALADVAATREMLEDAGFSGIEATPVDCPLVIGTGSSDAEACDNAMMILADAGPASRALREAEPAMREAGLALMRTGVTAHVSRGVVTLGGACWIYTGRA